MLVLRRGLALWPLPREEGKGKLVAIADRQDDARPAEAARRAAGPARARQVAEPGALTVKGVSDDPNGDELAYTLYVRPADGARWREVATKLRDPFHTLRATSLPDGYYVFRVRVSDAPSNPAGRERGDSRAVLIDNTPPQLAPRRVAVRAGRVTARGTARDALGALGALVELSYALDGAAPRPLPHDDGVLDGPDEAFEVAPPGLPAGHHTLVVRAVDEAANEAAVASEFDVR